MFYPSVNVSTLFITSVYSRLTLVSVSAINFNGAVSTTEASFRYVCELKFEDWVCYFRHLSVCLHVGLSACNNWKSINGFHLKFILGVLNLVKHSSSDTRL